MKRTAEEWMQFADVNEEARHGRIARHDVFDAVILTMEQVAVFAEAVRAEALNDFAEHERRLNRPDTARDVERFRDEVKP